MQLYEVFHLATTYIYMHDVKAVSKYDCASSNTIYITDRLF